MTIPFAAVVATVTGVLDVSSTLTPLPQPIEPSAVQIELAIRIALNEVG
jgi:hypothetical protein